MRAAAVGSDAGIAERLNAVEATFDLFEPSIAGVSAWQLLRAPVARELMRAGARPLDGRQTWSRSELARKTMTDWARYLRLPRARVLVKSFVSGLVEVQENGRYRDVFFDDVLDVVGSHVKLEVQNARPRPGGWRAAHLPPRAATVGTDFGAQVLSRLRPSREASDLAGFFDDVISSELAITALGRHHIARKLDSFLWETRFYGHVLDRVRPQFVLVADTGEFSLFTAAKERGVRCIELQHGIFARDHPDALGATAAAHRERMIVPDALMLFGTHWEDELRAGGFYRDELRAAGSPRIDRFRARRASVRTPEAGTCRVLVTSGGLANDELARFVSETASLARKERFDCHFDVKLHPIYDSSAANAYEAAVGGARDVRILTSEQQPSTLELLSEADAHVSISSACHYEALGLGVPTIVLPLAGYETVLALVEAGHAALASTPRELLRLLRDAPDLQPDASVSERYYRPGALERIAAELA